LAVGDDNDFDSSTYIQKGADNQIVQSEGGLKWALEKNSFDLRDKRIVPFEDKDVKDLEITAPKMSYSLDKAGGKWNLATPTAMAADEGAVNRILAAIRNLRANSIPSEESKDLAKYGLDAPKATVGMTLTTGNARLSLMLGQKGEGPEKKTYAKRGESPWIAEVPNTIIDDLDKPISDLRDKTVLPLDRDKVGALVIESPTVQIRLEKHKPTVDGGQEEWVETTPHQASAKRYKASNILWAMSSLKAVSFTAEKVADLAKYGLDKPSRTVTFLDESGTSMGTLKFGKESGANVYASSSLSSQVVEVEKNRLNELPNSAADVEEAPPAAAVDGGSGTKGPG
jgi:hypothetical protein